MKTKDAVKHFGGYQAVADIVGISRQAVYQWNNIVPITHAWTLRVKSNYKLALKATDYKPEGLE